MVGKGLSDAHASHAGYPVQYLGTLVGVPVRYDRQRSERALTVQKGKSLGSSALDGQSIEVQYNSKDKRVNSKGT